MTKRKLTTAERCRREGRLAFAAGLSGSSNPYPAIFGQPHSECHYWTIGWWQARDRAADDALDAAIERGEVEE